MIYKFGLLFLLSSLIKADRDDKKWVWGSNNRHESSRNFDSSPSPRYEVFENEQYQDRPNFVNDGRPFLNRPNNNRPPIINDRPYLGRPFEGPGPNRPLLTPERPGGVYGPNIPGNGNYGNNQGPFGNDNQDEIIHDPKEGVLTGPVPSWVKQGPFKEFDRCKCAAKFNCNSPGISYGHCDVGKQYCCYSTKKSSIIGGPPPSRPIHSPENGVLVGPGSQGPVRPIRPPFNGPNYPGPIGGGIYGRPQPGSHRPDFGYNRPGRLEGNTHSLENGILVGPGGPFDVPRPHRGGGGYGSLERSAKKV